MAMVKPLLTWRPMARKKKEQDPKEAQLKELFDSLVAGKTPEEIFGKGGLMSQLRKRLAESALEGEMVAHLGYEKHALEGRNRGNSRNGKGSKRVETESGALEIEVPRDR